MEKRESPKSSKQEIEKTLSLYLWEPCLRLTISLTIKTSTHFAQISCPFPLIITPEAVSLPINPMKYDCTSKNYSRINAFADFKYLIVSDPHRWSWIRALAAKLWAEPKNSTEWKMNSDCISVTRDFTLDHLEKWTYMLWHNI